MTGNEPAYQFPCGCVTVLMGNQDLHRMVACPDHPGKFMSWEMRAKCVKFFKEAPQVFAWSRGIPDKPGYYWMRIPGKASQPVHVAEAGLVFAIYFDDAIAVDKLAEHEFCPATPPE